MSATDPQHDAPIGRLLAGRYRIEAVIARGGMAMVCRARDERLARAVAVKVLSRPYAEDAQFVERFLSEARTAAAFSHPNLAHVYDSGSEGDLRFIVMELLDRSRSLREVIRQRGHLPPLDAAGILVDVLAGLEPLHEAGLVHCDVKAGNVMIGPDGTKLIDFGIARPLRMTGNRYTSIGSLHTMSPEQVRGEALTPASDLFAAGVVLYEALSGRLPFPGDTVEELVAAHARGPAGAPSDHVPGIAPRMDAVALQALQRDPAQRFASVAAMRVALNAATQAQREIGRRPDDETTATMRVMPTVRPSPRRQPRPGTASRRPGAGALLFAGALALPVLLVAFILFSAEGLDGAVEPSPTPQPTATAAPTLAPGMVRVPNTIGMSEREAEAAAREAGLAWRIEWQVVPGQTPGIYDQEPAPGEVVEAGSRFVMYAYRSR